MDGEADYHFGFQVAVVGTDAGSRRRVVDSVLRSKHVTVLERAKADEISHVVALYDDAGTLLQIELVEVPTEGRHASTAKYLCQGSTVMVIAIEASAHASEWEAAASHCSSDCCVIVAITSENAPTETMISEARHWAQSRSFLSLQLGFEDVLTVVVATAAELIPNPPDPSALVGTHIRIGTLVEGDEMFREALVVSNTGLEA
mmetsp:Transcript_56035/g.128625  ORF Transcript_56035/g.128625 Transcript_56035/m.128625 type:complete len:203 (-) Transcript_56035:226-834(-)